jgi:cGMP-dependent protein kinase
MFDVATVLAVDGRTNSLKGTPHYLAPEIIYDYSGYSYQVDFWSLGILLYEIICGCLPFGNNLDDPNEIYKAVMNEYIYYLFNKIIFFKRIIIS